MSRKPKAAKLSKRSRTKRERLEDPRLPADPLVTDEPSVGKYGEVFALSDNSGQCPVSGGSYYIFLDQSKGNITLLHPFTLTKFAMDLPAFVLARGPKDWDPAPAKLVEYFEKKFKEWRSLKREIPSYLQLLVKHYTELAETSII